MSPSSPKQTMSVRDRPVAQARQHREHRGQVGRGLADAHAAHDVDEHVLARRWRCRRAGAAPRAAARAGSTRIRPRRAAATCPGASSTSACTSTSSGRLPSRATVTTLPGTGVSCRDRKIADGLRTSFRPCSAIANTPISFAAPKRFLTARTTRKRLPGSLSKYSTVSTMCSRMRGPAISPSLVTCPMMSTAVPDVLGVPHQPRRGLAHLHRRAGRRLRQFRVHGLDRVDHEHPRARRLRLLDDRSRRASPRRAAACPTRARGAARAARPAAPTPRRTRTAPAGRGSARRRPAAAASTCRCRGRRRAASTEPATRPPPSTRSSSPMPEAARSSVSSRDLRHRSAGAAPPRPARRPAPARPRTRPARACSRPGRPDTVPATGACARRRIRTRSSTLGLAIDLHPTPGTPTPGPAMLARSARASPDV